MTTEELDALALIFGDTLIAKTDGGVDFTDFIGTGITLKNIDKVARHFNNQMLELAQERGDSFDGMQVSYYAPMQ